MITGTIKKYDTINPFVDGNAALMAAIAGPLSGYLGGIDTTGPIVAELERIWAKKFHVTHAIACNSATSGLLAACAAVGIEYRDFVLVSPYTMSATAAAPSFFTKNIIFVDVEDQHYCMSPRLVADALERERAKAVIVTNLFGHPAELEIIKQLAHANGAFLIEDNAQSILATENGVYAGTIGDIGVFSLNVHKHIQCGEGGIVVTDNDEFALAVRRFINHGEMAGELQVGLNLRITEVTAAIAITQLQDAETLVASRVKLARKLENGLNGNSMVEITPTRDSCHNVYYTLPMKVTPQYDRSKVVQLLRSHRVPIEEGYVAPLYWLPAFGSQKNICPVTEKLHKEQLIYFEVCGYDPTDSQVLQIIEAFNAVAKRPEAKKA